MLEVEKLKFGDVVYVVNEQNNAFSKKKIKMIDENGVEWFRYDRDHWEYSVNEIVYCGRVTYIEEGDVRFDENRQEELHFKFPDGQIYSDYIEDVIECQEWFHTQQEAEAYIELLKKERAE
jgi:hypothetical protein